LALEARLDGRLDGLGASGRARALEQIRVDVDEAPGLAEDMSPAILALHRPPDASGCSRGERLKPHG
jgi:hypothetical protein